MNENQPELGEAPPQTFRSTTQPLPTAAKKNGNKIGKITAALVLAGALNAGIGGAAGAGIATALSDKQTTTTVAEGNTKTATISKASSNTGVIRTALPSIVTVNVKTETGEAGTGSGVVFDEAGYIVTNAHVATLGGMSNNGTISIQTYAGETEEVELVGADPISDLAVLKTTLDLSAVEFATSSNVQVGDETIAIGSPLGLSGTVTTGIVSALNRPITVQSSDVNHYQGENIALNVIQTDAAINSGNSGGALLDSEGKLIGVNVAIASTDSSSGNIGVGFAIPSNYVKDVVTSLITSGKVNHGYVGVGVEDYSSDNSFITGTKIVKVEKGSPAEKAGLKEGDVVTKVNGNPISSTTQFIAIVKQTLEGSTVALTVNRGNEEEILELQTTTLA